MNFYLDFEATQFSERIISIGCVTDSDKEFSTLVRPSKRDKVNKFITDLTGITQEMVEEADAADVCFLALRHFIRECANGEETFFFVYGNADKTFIDKTLYKMSDPEAKKFAYNLGASLIDFSKTVRCLFKVSNISLKNAVSYFRQEEVKQNHHSVDDAKLLRELVYMIDHNDMPRVDENAILVSKPKIKRVNVTIKSAPFESAKTNNNTTMPKMKIPEGYKSWVDVPLDWYPRGTILRCNRNGIVEYPYPCLENVYSYIKRKNSRSPMTDIKKRIKEAIVEGTNTYHNKWKVI